MANQQILIIHKFDTLFNILIELEKYFNFKIKSVNTNNIDDLSVEKNYLFISGNQKLNLTNQIKIKNFPIDIIKLLEIIEQFCVDSILKSGSE